MPQKPLALKYFNFNVNNTCVLCKDMYHLKNDQTKVSLSCSKVYHVLL